MWADRLAASTDLPTLLAALHRRPDYSSQPHSTRPQPTTRPGLDPFQRTPTGRFYPSHAAPRRLLEPFLYKPRLADVPLQAGTGQALSTTHFLSRQTSPTTHFLTPQRSPTPRCTTGRARPSHIDWSTRPQPVPTDYPLPYSTARTDDAGHFDPHRQSPTHLFHPNLTDDPLPAPPCPHRRSVSGSPLLTPTSRVTACRYVSRRLPVSALLTSNRLIASTPTDPYRHVSPCHGVPLRPNPTFLTGPVQHRTDEPIPFSSDHTDEPNPFCSHRPAKALPPRTHRLSVSTRPCSSRTTVHKGDQVNVVTIRSIQTEGLADPVHG